METFLRNWRQDALNRHQYDTAIFVGDKLLALTNSDNDAYSLAQTHFAAGNYTRALAFVTRSDLIQRSPRSRYLAAHCYIKQNRHEEALQILGEKNPVHLVTTTDAARRKLQHLSNGLTSKQHGKSKLPSRTDRADRSEEREREDAANIKHEAGMCYLRGLCYAKQNAFDRAKECYKDAVRIDVQCFEAFDQLVKNCLLSPSEEWGFLDTLNFETIQPEPGDAEIAAEAAEFTKNLYSTRLSKYTQPEVFETAIETLSSHYRLAQNPDILLAKAEIAFTSSRYQEAVNLTNQILDSDPYNFACLPLHLSLLYQLNHHHALFSLSHDLADTHPDEPCTWLAVGTYYLATNRINEARSYFSKASLMDPHFGAAWIGFAHTFAAEGESDQAIAAYSTAARLFQGTHLPQMFLGMQEIALGNLNIAREYLAAAFKLCQTDPTLVNELGVVAYLEDDYEIAVRHFANALELADKTGAPANQYTSTRLNLAHALRKAENFEEALQQFEEVIRLGLRDASVFASKGLVLMELDQYFEATVALHEALAISPQDPIASDLLSKALGQLENEGVLGGADENAIDNALQEKVSRIRGTRRTRRRARIDQTDDMDLDGTNDS
ncbi:hypothetical protein AC578_3431 [Pseudocercospora eumusae]|uniref:Anaphase-promoting complex subunit cut9 n=1 Tax=Pseudocercospora eumusae TaxID=321146 RepID=A0A139HR12_9PEZI|nr:hypothetical protein AC578_3431 [Pseudocercospora eumusae]